MSENEVQGRIRQSTTEVMMLAAVQHGIGSIRELINLSHFLGTTIESAQEAIHHLSDDGWITIGNDYGLSITVEGTGVVEQIVEQGSPIDQMATLSSEYIPKMRALGAQALAPLINVDDPSPERA